MKHKPHIEVVTHTQATQTTHWWKIVSSNGRILATSETYKTSTGAKRAARKAAYSLGLEVRAKLG